MKKIILIVILLLIIAVSGIYLYVRNKLFIANIKMDKQYDYLYVPTGATLQNVLDSLQNKNYLISKSSLLWLAEDKDYDNPIHKFIASRKNFRNKIKPGRYLIKNQMTNNELVNLIRSNSQSPITITLQNIKRKEQIAKKIGKLLETDSLQIINLLNNATFAKKNGFDIENIMSVFIPNTYEFYWNTSSEQFLNKMLKEYHKFWNSDRKHKAKKIGLSMIEVSILASIVQEETYRDKEKPVVAGLYINRLKQHMPLQADPTIKFALNNDSIKRILNKHLSVESPYNTYLKQGLPPGPICLPQIKSIDATLNYQKHSYIFMCAKEDFSGYHNFAKTIAEHNSNAKKYQAELNKRKLFK